MTGTTAICSKRGFQIRRLRARTHAAIDRQQLKPAEPAAPNPVRQRQANCTASCRVAAQLPHPQRWRAHPALLGGKPRRNYKATQHGYDLRPDAAGPPHAGRACRHGDQGWPRRRVARVASRSKTPSRAESRVALNKTESFNMEAATTWRFKETISRPHSWVFESRLCA